MTREEEFLQLTNIILSTARSTKELLEISEFGELDKIFGRVLEKLNDFFKRVERNLRDFLVFERYTACAYTSEIGYSILEIPEEIKNRVWELRDNIEICPFTEQECKCKKSMDYLKTRFEEKLNYLVNCGSAIRHSSEDIMRGIEKLGKQVEALTESAKKIMNIAELIEIIALNAYIEAARLGEQGRGFKVIADEVRRASVRTNELASEIIESIKDLHSKFSAQIDMQANFDKSIANLEREQREFSEKLNKDLIWMAQNFIDFMTYVKGTVDEDVKLLNEVKETILSSLQTIDLTNQRVMNTSRALSIVAEMIEEFERVLKKEKDVKDALVYIESLYEEFRRIPKLFKEREIIAKAEGKEIDKSKEIVGKKLEDVETDVELF